MPIKSTSIKFPILILLLSFCAGIALYLFNSQSAYKTGVEELQGVLRPEARELLDFSLTDQNGQPFNLNRFSDGWSFVFFGYTYCPDICPTTLTTLVSVYKQLEQQGESIENLNTFFISVDPQRDTPEVLRGYMSYFNEAFVGVTGEKELLDAFARQFGAGYVVEPEQAPGVYLVSHTSSIFLVDPQKRLRAHFSPPHDATTIAEQFRKIKSLR